MKGSRIIVASGKAGMGRTTVATSLAIALQRGLPEVQFLDCDIEEPDARIFLKPEIESQTEVTIGVPHVDVEKCNGCGECQSICRFNAIALVSGKAQITEDLCQGCGGCRLVCDEGAVTEKRKRIGVIESGMRYNLIYHGGVLDVGRRVSLPFLYGLNAVARSDVPTILDSEGVCHTPAIQTLLDCDYCILVTEPTPFGLHDLKLVTEVIGGLGIPAGIVINKDEGRSSGVEEFAAEQSLPILMRLPFSKEIASLCSQGVALTEADDLYDERFWSLYEEVERTVWRT